MWHSLRLHGGAARGMSGLRVYRSNHIELLAELLAHCVRRQFQVSFELRAGVAGGGVAVAILAAFQPCRDHAGLIGAQ